ncbi:MAG: phosphoglucosamine mutase [Verrucomicrobia bacterium]|nr:phosphoglucosamine mutase [Verrucomicrobiota bacterium]
MRRYFGTDGIRGTANVEPLTPATILRLAQAAALELGGGPDAPLKVLIGHDTRASREMIESALIAGLVSMGADVYLAGVVPTPAVAFLTQKFGANAGIAITASHNPWQDNGIKFFRADGFKLDDEIEARIEARLAAAEPAPSGGRIGRVRYIDDADTRYIAAACATVPEGFSLHGMKIALDCANGAAFRTTPGALGRLGAKVVIGHAEPDGENINRDCGSTHPEAIAELVRATGAQLGISHDGDADRLILCDEQGEIVDGDELLAIVALDHLRRGALAQNTLVATVMSNFGLEEALAPAGGQVVRSAVGDRYVLAEMLARGLNVGGEQSGHVIFLDHSTTGDGLVAALQILRVMVETGQPLSALKRVLVKYPQAQRNLRVKSKPPLASLPQASAAIAAAEAQLGARGRVLVRYSGTEPKVRVLVEGREAAQIEALADGIAAALQAEIG